MVYIKLNWESRPKMHSIFVFFFHLLTVEQKGNMKIIRRKIMQQAERAIYIDVVISRHINI